MIALTLLVLMLLVLLAGVTYLLGFRLGGSHWQQELGRVRSESAQAGRDMHQLTRAAFVAMAEEAAKHRRGR